MIIGGLLKLSLIDFPQGTPCIVIFTAGCNLRCPFCHNADLVAKKVQPIETEEVLAFLNSRKGIVPAVVFSGGEPLLQEDIYDYLKTVKQMGYKIKLDTNGTLPERLALTISTGLVDYVAMDIKAPLSKYSLACGKIVDTAKIKESIGILKTLDVDYEFRTTVFKNFIPSVEDMMALALLIKDAKRYYLQKPQIEHVLDQSFPFEVPTDEELEVYKNIASNFIQEVYIR